MVLPYTIKHIQLDQLSEKNIISKLDGSSYYFFWWRQIPLGHLFVEHHKVFNNSDADYKILTVIASTVNFYNAKPELTDVYRRAFLEKDYVGFTKTMDEIFGTYSSEKIIAENKLDISVIICTRNRSTDLQVCLESLFKQICIPKEIIIVDNAPTDDSTLKVVEKFKGVTYCKEPKPGLSIARNTGIQKAQYPIIAWVDDDVQVHPLWAYRVWETFLTPSITAMTGLVIASSLDTESQQIFEKFWSFNRGYQDHFYDSLFYHNTLPFGPKASDIGAGANMAFRASVFKEKGDFNELLGAGASGCSEDSEMWYRIIADKRFTIQYNPRCIVYHKHRRELSSLNKQLFSYMRGHVVAVLIQQTQNSEAGYLKYLYKGLPIYYLRLFKSGFPFYSHRFRTLLSESKGIISGLRFYHKNKKKLPVINDKSIQL
ncbi:glycosyltransferase family 2 protein [uncultured Mucilaginibacter sp.]|uniref:glycosyltransferase family 2 protein n=1 Tax=uncultured Mucilaginibacter sp. TaxID=797541 RepID=UPI0026030B35|nr:glycosyltransferase family 2 protein [uncultured Mucilaginibacter sp.]